MKLLATALTFLSLVSAQSNALTNEQKQPKAVTMKHFIISVKR
jgi:hypothetical protein